MPDSANRCRSDSDAKKAVLLSRINRKFRQVNKVGLDSSVSSRQTLRGIGGIQLALPHSVTLSAQFPDQTLLALKRPGAPDRLCIVQQIHAQTTAEGGDPRGVHGTFRQIHSSTSGASSCLCSFSRGRSLFPRGHDVSLRGPLPSLREVPQHPMIPNPPARKKPGVDRTAPHPWDCGIAWSRVPSFPEPRLSPPETCFRSPGDGRLSGAPPLKALSSSHWNPTLGYRFVFQAGCLGGTALMTRMLGMGLPQACESHNLVQPIRAYPQAKNHHHP